MRFNAPVLRPRDAALKPGMPSSSSGDSSPVSSTSFLFDGAEARVPSYPRWNGSGCMRILNRILGHRIDDPFQRELSPDVLSADRV
jgi:hypothetical protein